MLDSSKRKALLEWVNCLGIGCPLDSLVQLRDGVDFLRIIHISDPSSPCEIEIPEERFRIIARFLNEFYKTNTDMLIHYDKCLHGSELELAKTAVLLLCAAVQQSLCPSTQPLITSLTQLDEGVQKEIRECLEAVLLPSNDINGHLTADFVSVLCKQSLQNETTPRKHSCVNSLSNLRSLTKIKTPSHYSSQGSPLRALLDSPLLVQRVAVREKEKELSSLRNRLVQQENQRLELEDELHNIQKELAEKEKEQIELRKTVSELRKIKETVDRASEYKVTADRYQEELEHLRYRLRDLENLKFINERVEADNQSMTDKQVQLETEVLNLREQVVNIRKKEQEEREREGLIAQLNSNSKELEMEVKRLQEALQESQNELEKTCQLYNERVAALERNSSSPKAFSPQGECMGKVFSDLRVSELECVLEQLRSQLESQKELSQFLEREKTSIQNEVVSYTRKVEMLESQLCQSLNEKTVVEKELREQLEMLAIEKEKTLELLRSTQYEQNKLLEDHTNLEQEKQKIEEDAKKLRMENNNLTLNIQELEIEKCKIETDCQDKAEKMSCLWKELENLQALLSSAQKSENCLNSEYQEHLQECQKEKLIYCEKISTFESQVNNLTVEKYEIQKRFQKNIDELYQEVETKKQELKTMQVDFQVKVQQMQCVEAELNTRIDSLSQRNEESENVITEKHKEITQLKEEKEGYSQEKLKLEMQLQKGYEKLKSEEEKRMKLESEKNEFLNQLKQLDDKISKLESNVDCLIKEKTELYQASERNLCIMNKLKNELRKAEERNFSLTECKASLERKHEAQLKINISEKEQFTKRVSQAENQCITLKEEIIGKEKVWKEEMENLQKHFVSQVNKLHSDIAEYTEFNQQLKNKLNDVRKENEEEKRNLLNKLTQSETKVESVKKEKEETVNALFNKTKSLENENQLLIEKINETERNFQNMQESKKTLESEYYMCVEQKEHDKELLSKNISELLEQKKKMEDQYQSQIIQSRKEIQVLVSEKEEEHSSFQLEKQILKNQIDEFLSINGTLEVKADQLEKELQQSHAQLKEIKQELEYTKVIHSEEVEKYDSAQKFFQGKIGVLENDLNQKNENIGKYVEEIKEKEAYICDIRRIIKDLQAVIKETKNIASSKKDKKNISFALMSVVEEITTNNAKQLQTDEEKKLNGSKIQIEETSEHIENHQLEMEKRVTSVSEKLNWSNSQVPELENHREKIQKEFIWQETNNSKEEAQIKEDRKLIASCDELIASEESFANVDKENEMLENLVILVKSVNQELEGKLISVELTKDTLSSKIDELEPQVKELLKCKNTFESLVETLDKEKSELENAYQQQKLFIEALEKEKKILETKVSEISNAYEQSTTSFEIIQAKKIELENIKERLERDVLNLKQEKEEIQDNLNHLSEDNAVLNSKFTDVKHEKERLEKELLELQKTINDLQGSRKKDSDLHNDQLIVLQKEKDIVLKEKLEAEKVTKELLSAMEILKDENNSLNLTSDTQNSILEELEFRNQQLVKDKEALETIAKQFENEKKELKTKTQNCESLVKNFEMENKSLSEKVILLEEQQAKLSCQLKNTQEEKEETEKKYKDLKARWNTELTNFSAEVKQLHIEAGESEARNREFVKTLKSELDNVRSKYEATKKVIGRLDAEKQEKEKLCNRYSEQIDVYKAYTSEKKNQVNELQKSLENQKQALLQEKRTVAAFQSDLKDAHEKISTLEENIEQHKAILNHEKEQNKLLEVQLQYASSEIRKLQKERNSSNESLSQMQNKVNLASSQSQPSVGNTVQHLASSAYSVTMMLPHEAMDNIFNVEEKRPLKSASTQTVSQVPSITISRFNPTVSYAEDNLSGCFNNIESVHCSFNMTSNSLNPLNSLSLLARTGNEFPCEDEEGQFMDNTNLIDLKAGRCKVDGGNWRRLTELQRRNTLCLPHLKTSYPVETQMHDIRNFPDDALKAGPVIEEPFILRERTNKLMSDRRMTLAISNLTADKVHTSPTGNKRKRTDSTESESSIGSFKGRGAPLQPTYSKPGPPTPGKTRLSKQQLASSISPAPFSNASKIFKTPSSIKKKLRERFSRTPKEGKSSKYNKRKLGKENEW